MGWFGNAFLIVGLWYLHPRRRWPFLMTAVGESIWTVRSVCLGYIDMAFICGLFAYLSVRNFRRWGKQP